jgi:multisubunit Na+/H+ antiporter MnhB subunit
MVIGDFIAIGIVLFCIVLGISGALKWLMRLLLGAALGLLVLALIGLLVSNQRFDNISHGLFKQGVVIPYIRHQVGMAGHFVHEKTEFASKMMVAND